MRVKDRPRQGDQRRTQAEAPIARALVMSGAAKGAGERAASQQFPGTGKRQVEGHSRGRADQRDIESKGCKPDRADDPQQSIGPSAKSSEPRERSR